MAKLHVTSSGQARPCSAQPGNCKYAVKKHTFCCIYKSK